MSYLKRNFDKDPGNGMVNFHLGKTELGRMDFPVMEEFHSSQLGFVHSSICNQLPGHVNVVYKFIERHLMKTGLRKFRRADQDAPQNEGEKLRDSLARCVRIDPESRAVCAWAPITFICVQGTQCAVSAGHTHFLIAPPQRCVTKDKD